MTLVDQDDVMQMMEGCVRAVWEHVLEVATPRPLPRLTYAEAIRDYGSDKPDLRFDLKLTDVDGLFRGGDFGLFAGLAESDANRIAAVRYPGGAALSRRDFDALAPLPTGFRAKGPGHASSTPAGGK